MARVVQKYGGSSVADPAMIGRVARRIVTTRRAGHDDVVVASAMGDTTDDVTRLGSQVARRPPERELDMLLSSNFELASRSDLRLTARCLPGECEAAVRALHEVFDLGRARVARAAAAGGVE